MKDKELELSNLQQETAIEYFTFIKNVFRQANEKDKLKELINEIAFEFLSDDMNRKNMTLGGITKLLSELNRTSNDFQIGIMNSIVKGKSENPSFMPPPASNEKHVGEGGQGNNPSPEDIKQAKRILDLLENVKKLGESEK